MCAVDHYLEYGKCYSRTGRVLGYPSRALLTQWVMELAPQPRKFKRIRINLTSEEKEATVLALPDKYSDVRAQIIDVFEKNKRRYGYRRIHASLNNIGIILSEKTVRRIMQEENLVTKSIKMR